MEMQRNEYLLLLVEKQQDNMPCYQTVTSNSRYNRVYLPLALRGGGRGQVHAMMHVE